MFRTVFHEPVCKIWQSKGLSEDFISLVAISIDKLFDLDTQNGSLEKHIVFDIEEGCDVEDEVAFFRALVSGQAISC